MDNKKVRENLNDLIDDFLFDNQNALITYCMRTDDVFENTYFEGNELLLSFCASCPKSRNYVLLSNGDVRILGIEHKATGGVCWNGDDEYFDEYETILTVGDKVGEVYFNEEFNVEEFCENVFVQLEGIAFDVEEPRRIQREKDLQRRKDLSDEEIFKEEFLNGDGDAQIIDEEDLIIEQEQVTIINNGQIVDSTNFYKTCYAKQGLFLRGLKK